MMEEAIQAIWASVSSWFTPTVLFVLINLVIGTIAIRTRAHHRNDNVDGTTDPPANLYRSPSVILDRLRSFKLYRPSSTEIPLETAPLPPETIDTTDAPPDPAVHVSPAPGEEHRHLRSQSDIHLTAGEAPMKLERKMMKSASVKSAFSHIEEAEITRRPATAREREEEREFDARADDFISRFRQQLKLQRLDSIIRYKEILNRGN